MKLVSVRRKVLATALTAAVLATGNVFPTAAADAPSLSLIVGKDEIKVRRKKGRPAYFDPGVFLTASGGPLELWVRRGSYDEPLAVYQAVYSDAGIEMRPLPADVLDPYSGLKDFYTIEARNSNGKLVSTSTLPFCPSGWDKQRVNDSGPVVPDYPSFCFLNPFAKSVVWGLEEGWASGAASFEGAVIDGKDGHYDVTVSVAPQYVSLFNIPPESASATVGVAVKSVKRCRHHCGGGPIVGAESAARSQRPSGAPVPSMDNPDASVLPDLVSLPAWSIYIERRGDDKEYLTFAANVWTAGASPLVVEGFRRQNSGIMDAYQYFYKDGAPVGRSPAGTLEYDNRRGHTHWHFQQFAGYRLLNADQTEAVRSRKEAFCLAATDPIDLSLPGAEWSPEVGLHTACGAPNSIWIREVLPLGWGDTYYQGLPGQSFNITDLPNGTYYIEVQANPLGTLKEQDLSNNTQLREVIIKGRPGHRKAEVAPWHGIDTEGPFFNAEQLRTTD